jgi:PAS domain S-box-containing protein
MTFINFSSLRIRLLALVMISVLPALGLLFYAASVQRSEKEAEIREDTVDLAKAVANNIEKLVEESRQILAVLSKLPAVQNYDSTTCNAYFSEFKELLPYNNIGAVKLNGDMFCSAFPLHNRKINLSDRLYIQTAMQKRIYFIGEYHVGKVIGKPSIAASFPILDKKKVKGVVYAAVDLYWFKDQMSKVRIPEKATMTVIDRNGTILYRYPDAEQWMGKNVLSREIIRIVLDQKEGMAEAVGLDGKKRIYAFTPVHGTDNGMFVRIGISPEVAFVDINRRLVTNLLLLLLLACLTCIVAWFGGNYFIMNRIRTLMKATEDLSKGNLGSRVDVARQKDEISQLGNSFNAMAATLERQINERKQAEEALIRSEEKYRALFEESKDLIFMSTPGGTYLDMNPAGLELLGYSSKEELFTVDITNDIFVYPDQRSTYQTILREKGYVKDFEITMKRRDGKQLTVLSTATVVKNKNGDVIAYRGIQRDITEHKRLEQQLLQAQKMEAVGQLAGGIAHDFNNILTAIVGFGNLLKRKLGSGAGLKEKEYVEQILAAAERAADVVRSLLTFSRKQVMDPQQVNLNDVVKRFEKLLSRIIGEDIEVEMLLAPGDVIGLVDAGRIEQVLMNLATNARDAMTRGGKLTISTEMVAIDDLFVREHGYGKPGPYALISVSDTGAGMKPETLKKIFEPFFTTKETGKGTGLGLAMVYGIIKQHEGYITVSSKPGVGTTFRIYLPAATVPGERCVKQTVSPVLRDGTETVLVAEDDAQLRELTEHILSQSGYKVILARDGEEAMTLFRESKDDIQLVILDVLMPKKSGYDTYVEMKRIRPDIKSIFFSGYTADRIRQDNLHLGQINLLLKPVAPEDLLVKVRTVLDA